MFDFIHPGDLVFDIGALEGKYTQRFLDKGARVVAVEPQGSRAAHLGVKFAGRPLNVVCAACGAVPGKAKLYLTAVPWLATLDPEKWKKSRFSGYDWRNSVEIEVTTLDKLIEQYGEPAYIKIDVEGCEPQVLQGLSTPVRAVSWEFVGEYLEDVETCGKRLNSLGDYEYAISYYDHDAPKPYKALRNILNELRESKLNLLWGDIYARRVYG